MAARLPMRATASDRPYPELLKGSGQASTGDSIQCFDKFCKGFCDEFEWKTRAFVIDSSTSPVYTYGR